MSEMSPDHQQRAQQDTDPTGNREPVAGGSDGHDRGGNPGAENQSQITALRVWTFASIGLLVLHLLLALLVDCLRELNFALALLHGGFAVYAYMSTDPTGDPNPQGGGSAGHDHGRGTGG